MTQKEFFGIGCIESIKNLLKESGVKKIFLVTGKNSYTISGMSKVISEMQDEFDFLRFSNFSENPKIEDVIRGIDLLRKSGCEIIIAAGGGSVIDMAKSINILGAQGDETESIIKGEKQIHKKNKELIAIPTTSGAGSEATHFAVVYIGKEKYSIAHQYILPDKVIIDPELTFNLNSRQTAISGMDALAQSIESHWSINSNTESKKFSLESIELIFKNLEQAVKNPDVQNRVSMSRAANLAGKAINITKTTAPHALSYSMTSYFGVPHGQAVSISLGEFLEYNYEVTDNDIAGSLSVENVRTSIDEIVAASGCKNVAGLKEKIKNLLQSTGLKTKLSELNIKSHDDLKIISGNINPERVKNNPRKITIEEVDRILKNIS